MLTSYSSALLLKTLWDDFEKRYTKQMSHKPSKSQMCSQLGLDKDSLSKWMNQDGHKNRRIPVEHIERISEAMMLAPEQKASLMKVRLREIAGDDPSMKVLFGWISETVKQSVTRRHALQQDEALVLELFRKAREDFPRGLYFDSGEKEALQQQFQRLLKTAEENHCAEARADEIQETTNVADGIKISSDKMRRHFEKSSRAQPKPFKAALLSAASLGKK